MRWKNTSLTVKFAVTISIAVAVAVTGVTVTAISREQGNFRSELEEETRLILDSVAVGVSDMLYFANAYRLADIARRLADTPMVTAVRFYDSEGRVLADSADPDAWLNLNADPHGLRLADAGTILFDWQPDTLQAGRGVFAGSEYLGAISITMSTQPLAVKLAAIRDQGLGVALLAIVGGIALALIVSRSITKPLQILVTETQHIAKGDLTRLIPEEGTGEVKVLAGALNEMVIELEQTVARKAAILEATHDGIISMDKETRVIEFNPAAEQMFGYGHREAMALELSDLIAMPINELSGRLASRESQANGDGTTPGHQVEVAGIRADGSHFSAELAMTHITYHDQLIYIAIVRDISERKQAETTLRESEERLKILFESAPDAYYLNTIAGTFLDGNRAAEKLVGYQRDDLIGKNFLKLNLLPMNQVPKAARLLAHNARGLPTGPDEFTLNNKDKGPVTVDISTFPVKIKGRHVVLGIARDVSERKEAEAALRNAHDQLEQRVAERTSALTQANLLLQQEVQTRKQAEDGLETSLHEKEVLLKEIHHRVKNNLQVISSLLYLQSRKVEDDVALAMLQDSQNRVRSMALVHERLYRSENLSQIAFDEYIDNLAIYLSETYSFDHKTVRLTTQMDSCQIDIEKAIPCGLIVNELVSNALKHAFPNGAQGEVRVGLSSHTDSRLTLVVSDNGIGFPEDMDFRNTSSLGLQLVNSLVDQLEGTCDLERGGGTTFRIDMSL